MKHKLIAILTCAVLTVSALAAYAGCGGPEKMEQAALQITAVTGKRAGGEPFQLSVTGGSGTGAVTFTRESGTAASVSGSGVVTVTDAGTISVKATKAGDGEYKPVTSAALSLTFSESLTLYKDDFSAKNSAFVPWNDGIITYNAAAKTVTVTTPDPGDYEAPDDYQFESVMTRFERTDGSPIPWAQGGITVAIDVKIDAAGIPDGTGFTWTVGLSQKGAEGSSFPYFSEAYLYFRKYGDVIRAGSTGTGSLGNSDGLNAKNTASANEDSAPLPDGWYTLVYKFFENDDDVIEAALSVVNAADTAVFTMDPYALRGIIGQTCTAEQIAGVRYAWLCFLSAEALEIGGIEAIKNAS